MGFEFVEVDPFVNVLIENISDISEPLSTRLFPCIPALSDLIGGRSTASCFFFLSCHWQSIVIELRRSQIVKVQTFGC